MNSHIHMLEALSALYGVWKDGEVRERLEEVLRIVRDRVAVEPGCLNLFFTRDWRPVPDHDSYGHDIETAFLLIEAAESLGEGIDGKTLGMARMLVDHALDWGWDEQHGGFYDKGFALSAAFDKKKVWWSQVEGLNALLLMHEQFGVESDRYWQAFVKQWQFVRRFQIDSEFGGLYGEVEADGAPISTTKGQNWKAGYHDGRSFMLVADRLRGLSAASVKAGR
jgi:mannobiose 2-epimerase